MSSGLECEFVQITDTGDWYYFLQQGSCPVQCWDWREFADCFGPFKDEDTAQKHLFDNHSNPGGWSTRALTLAALDDNERRLIEEAPALTRAWRRW